MSEEIRRQLIEAGIVILERDGLQALTVRKLAAEVDTSTMVVYTHFGSMTGVVDALSAEIFARFGAALAAIPHTDDPVADFFSMGAAYRRFALKNPQHYQLMFGTTVPASLSSVRSDLTVTGHATSRDVSFQTLCESVRRMTDADRIRDDGEAAVAGRIWSMCHGAVMLEMAGFFGTEGHGLRDILSPMAVDLLVGMGDDRERARASLASAAAALLASGHL